MKLDEILSAAGKNKGRKRLGRGDGSGLGKTSGRGHKGYGQRSGAKKRMGYEGGQASYISRIPKRGFNNKNFKTVYQVVNVATLEDRFDDGATVDAESLVAAGLIDNTNDPVKILGNGELKKKLTVKAEKLSASAKEKIEGAGGSVELIDRSPRPVPRNKGKAAKGLEAVRVSVPTTAEKAGEETAAEETAETQDTNDSNEEATE
jgi:large subunit ribosomal protein L15